MFTRLKSIYVILLCCLLALFAGCSDKSGDSGGSPSVPSNPFPADKAIVEHVDTVLSWTCSNRDGAELHYELFLGTNPDLPGPGFSPHDAWFRPENLQYETTYFWKVRAYDYHTGNVSHKAIGPLWQFTTIGNPYPHHPTPSHSSLNVSPNARLSWLHTDPQGDSVTFDVYFGPENPPIVATDQTSFDYEPGFLEFWTNYYWRIVAHNSRGNEVSSPIWTFRTQTGPRDVVPCQWQRQSRVFPLCHQCLCAWRLCLRIRIYPGLRIFDVSNPQLPVLTGQLDVGSRISGITLSGDYAYLAGYLGLFIVDVSSPSSPSLVGGYSAQDAKQVIVSGDYAYLNVPGQGLLIINLVDPTRPTLSGIYAGSANEIAIKDDYVLMADRTLKIIDVSNPAAPSFAAEVLTTDIEHDDLWINRVFVSGEIAYLSDTHDRLRLFSVADPTNPFQIARRYLGRGAIFESNGYVYVGTDGLCIVDANDQQNLPVIGGYQFSGATLGLSAAGDYIYVANGELGLQIFRLLP